MPVLLFVVHMLMVWRVHRLGDFGLITKFENVLGDGLVDIGWSMGTTYVIIPWTGHLKDQLMCRYRGHIFFVGYTDYGINVPSIQGRTRFYI